MSKNLIVKLPESVDKDLYRMGEIRLQLPSYKAGSRYSIMYPQPTLIECNVKGAKFNYSADGNFADNINPSGNKGCSIVFPTDGTDAVIRIWGIEKLSNILTYFAPYEVSVIMPNAEGDEYSIDNFKYLPNNIIRMTYRGDNKIHGDIKAFKDKTSLIKIILDNTSVSGDISALKNLTALTALSLYNTSVSGDISALKNLTALTTLWLDNTSVSGDISALSNMANLSDCSIPCINLVGDVSVFDNLLKLTKLGLPKNGKITYTDAQIESLRNRGVTITFYNI